MTAFFWNLSFWEVVLIAIVSVMIFGRRLPEVASQTFRQVTKLRRNLEDLRRESGIDRELRDVRGTLRDLTRDVDAPLPYQGQPILRDRPEPRLVQPEPPAPPPPPPAAGAPAEDLPAGGRPAGDAPRPTA